jgi:hypothetical protein
MRKPSLKYFATKLQRNCNEISPTWNKKQFIECNIMVQKYLAMVAILGAIAALSIGMVTTGQVNAFERTCHFWSNGDSQCENGPFFAYHQQPTVKQVSNDCNAGWDCCNTNPAACNNGVTVQPHISMVAEVVPTNCFWSYPVQCN